jgi:amino acid permease
MGPDNERLLQTTLPTAIRPQGSKAVISYEAVITIGSTATQFVLTSYLLVKWHFMAVFKAPQIYHPDKP